jgi:multidrug efflux pump subunit AcrA (membrane-fusion protein)
MQAQLGSQVAASIQAQAQIAGQGAQTVTQAGAVQAQTRQAAAALQTQAQNYRSAGLLAATQMEFNGRQAIAGLIQNNPRGVISKFAGFAALLQMGTIPGIVNATPVSEGLLT